MTETHHKVWAEISLGALRANLEAVRSRLAQGSGNTEIMAVVKADAYGHGESGIVSELYRCGIRYFAVSSIDEAISISAYLPRDDGGVPLADILILGHTIAQDAPFLQQNRIIQGVISLNHAEELSENCSTALPPLRCHIKLDTGMGRIGLKHTSPEKYAAEIHKICALPGIAAEGLYTHFSVADSILPDDIAYTKKQKKLFEEICILAQPLGFKHFHCMNSAAACGFAKPEGTLARIGIILYGLLPDRDFSMPISLRPVMSLKSIVAQICSHAKGDSVSYGRTFIARENMSLAVIPIGYADGYPRALSSKAEVLIRGRRCPVIGRICMDQMMVDVTGTDIREGDIVTLTGTDGNESITADELAALSGTIGYEIVCGISKRVPRIYTD